MDFVCLSGSTVIVFAGDLRLDFVSKAGLVQLNRICSVMHCVLWIHYVEGRTFVGELRWIERNVEAIQYVSLFMTSKGAPLFMFYLSQGR